ncbi:MAG: hypothetical protein COV72_06755 [Candidatus Omnitrophica bacterium CG11_big_fil_rev_8_21_14_0_20_42_13]|uniref:Uncharacterized protein n=1 Tax=Candidatus Ghiorseimicrobium undicola TaxID=1974746 RepID=A0A2H0LWL6_9BACT|nr:MAG: hypothetical protein COV72_06755 [Candidatus Omnitrophica bacterium CG11_big_fil_rev_8_21_14_0_20_42_13]
MDSALLEPYIPRNFCRDYALIKQGHGQLTMFMSLVLGIKPLMDDWMPVKKVKEFRKICKKYNLYVREDVIFENVNKESVPDNVLGREFLSTTSAYGHPLGSREDGQVHVFISKDKRLFEKCMWYPVIIGNRVIFQPRIDSLKYGYILGYPECCIKFFRKYNDWLKFSHLYQAYLNTKANPSFLCNPFLKDTVFSYIYHMPCSYSCRQTIKLANKLRNEIKKREPEYVKITDSRLKMPFLVFYERKFYCFDGELRGNLVRFKRAYFPAPHRHEDRYSADFKKIDRLELKGRSIVLFKRNKILKNLDVPLNTFAPEYPFLIQFS